MSEFGSSSRPTLGEAVREWTKAGGAMNISSFMGWDLAELTAFSAKPMTAKGDKFSIAREAIRKFDSAAKLPTEAKARKGMPICTGVLDYFPDAMAAIAEVSKRGNDQHNPGEPLHWAREKSTDHADCIARHLLERGTLDVDGGRHSAKMAWRALALLQTEIEAELLARRPAGQPLPRQVQSS